MGLYSLIEQVDRRFLESRFGKNDEGNLYKAYCGDLGCSTLEYRVGADGDDSGRQYRSKPDSDDPTYRLKTNEDDPAANSYDDLAEFVRRINGVGLPGGDPVGTAASPPTRSARRLRPSSTRVCSCAGRAPTC